MNFPFIAIVAGGIGRAAALFKGVSVVSKLAGFFSGFAPFAAFLSPILGSVAEVAASAIRGFFKGIAITFANPAVILVILAASGAASFKTWGYEDKKLQALKGQLTDMKQQVAQNCPRTVVEKISRRTGVKITPKPEAKPADGFTANPFHIPGF